MADIGAATTPAERSRVMRDNVALGLAVGAFGISFGALAVTAGRRYGRRRHCRC